MTSLVFYGGPSVPLIDPELEVAAARVNFNAGLIDSEDYNRALKDYAKYRSAGDSGRPAGDLKLPPASLRKPESGTRPSRTLKVRNAVLETLDAAWRALPHHGRYRIGLVDAPWRFSAYTAAGERRSPQRHYKQSLTVDEILALPVAPLFGPDAALFLWVYDPLLPEALQAMARWGFRYSTRVFDWVKTARNGRPHHSNGYHTLMGSEICLLGLRGRGYRRAHTDVRQVLLAPRREHSRKPDEIHARIERLVGAGPAVELFGREERAGWDVWGNEVGRFA